MLLLSTINLFNHLNSELNPICHLMTLIGAHHIFHVSGIRVKFYRPLFIPSLSSSFGCGYVAYMMQLTSTSLYLLYQLFSCALSLNKILTPIGEAWKHNFSFLGCNSSPPPHPWAKATSLSRIHDHTLLDTPHWEGFLWTGDQLDAETST